MICRRSKSSVKKKRHPAEELHNIEDVCEANGYPWEMMRTSMEQRQHQWNKNVQIVRNKINNRVVGLRPYHN